jgi:predicted flavoprotein YhiN
MGRAGVTLWLECEVGGVAQEGTGFRVETARGVVRAASVVVATGGKSIPKMGATGFGYRLAEQFGVPLVETRPGLVPLTFAEHELGWMQTLAGVALPAKVSCGKVGFDEAVLFTHRGVSGPAILGSGSVLIWPVAAICRAICARPRRPMGGLRCAPFWRGSCPKNWPGTWSRT